ncbi:hypothetical protein DL96DRAFT_1625523 [Flagelloscypha sp. PMI_526]|nr:hypothetical protein DL96DRAFT_1625523 [Flagelloscypha sp. PMI_526]
MAMDLHCSLPAEVWINVFISVDKFHSLVSLSATSSGFRSIYLDNIRNMLRGVAYNELGQALPHLLRYLSFRYQDEEFELHPKTIHSYFEAVQWGEEWVDALQSWSSSWAFTNTDIPANYVYSAAELARLQQAIFNFWTFVAIWENDLTSSLDYLNEMQLSSHLSLSLVGSGAQQIGMRILKTSWNPLDIEKLVSMNPAMLGRLIRAEKDKSSISDITVQRCKHYRKSPYEELDVRMESLPLERRFGGWIICDAILERWEKRHASLSFRESQQARSSLYP